jgi:hypothetical protein
MVQLHETQLVITIPTERAGETLGKLQTGLVTLLKTTLAARPDEEEIDGCLAVVHLLEATLVDPATVEAAIYIAGQLPNIENEVGEISRRIKKMRADADDLSGK